MGKNTATRKHIRQAVNRFKGKRGSYIFEAALSIPIFFVAVMVMISIVPSIGVCENILFSTVDEMRFEMLKSAFRENSVVFPLKVTGRINRENSEAKSTYIKGYKYLYKEHGIEDLIEIRTRTSLSGNNPFGLYNTIIYDQTVTGRAFTGAYYTVTGNVSDDRYVFVFPDWGQVYHNVKCTYIVAGCNLVYLNKDIERDYKPCKICNASSAQTGSPVFCFMYSGRAYHLKECPTVDRYYIEVMKSEAISKGYRPCSKCGG